MLEKGITRDMFLIACDLKIKRERHLVVSGFALLGRADHQTQLNNKSEKEKSHHIIEYEKIKSEAAFRLHNIIEEDMIQSICVLLHFSASDN